MTPVRITVAVRVFGAQVDFEMRDDGSTVLAAARAAGIDLPSSCEAGVCSTCRARLLAGEVEMLCSVGLDAAELAAGYVLACQSLPRSSALELDFD